MTEYLPSGGYRVTRCGGGEMLVSQTASPVADPDGGIVLVPTEREEPGVRVAALYGYPSEPGWAREFRAVRRSLVASIIPPTPPSAALGGSTPTAHAPTRPAAAGGVAAPAPAPGPTPTPAPAPGPTPAPTTLVPAAIAPTTAPAGADSTPPALPSRLRTTRGELARAAVAGDACTNTQHGMWWGVWVGRSYGYRVNRGRFSYNDKTLASLVAGHHNWDTTQNSCGLNDVTNLTSQYLGSTSAPIHTYADGTSVTDKGDLASVGCAGALACTWVFTDANGWSTETDQRYNENIAFTNVGAAGAYDYASISTHESGHSIGLDHANSSDALTMHYTIRAGTTHARTLAKGDVLGLRARYP